VTFYEDSSNHGETKAVTWEAIRAIGQIVGALAVVISVIYLAREVRSSANATRQAAMRSTLDALNWFAKQITEHADLAELRSRGFHDYESLEGTDRSRFDTYMHALFRTVEDAYYQHLQGNFDPRLWRGFAVVLGELNTHFPEFRRGGVHARIGSVGRSLRSSSISNSKQPPGIMTSSQHVYEVRPRKGKRGAELISDVLPFGRPVMVDRTQPIRDQKITAPTPIGVKGGCSPQNYLGKVSKTDASQVCLGNTDLCRLCYVEFIYSCVSQADTLSVVPNAGNVIETQEHNGDLKEW